MYWLLQRVNYLFVSAALSELCVSALSFLFTFFSKFFAKPYTRSKITAIPCPTPMHIVHNAYCPFVRCN